MGWLLRDGEVLASTEVAATRRDRRRGLLGRDGVEGVLVLRPARSVHTIGMQFPIDVAWCAPVAGTEADAADGDVLVVVKLARVPRHRVTLPVLRARVVLEAEAGAFARWGIRPGDRLELS